jgi:hypothetical protein
VVDNNLINKTSYLTILNSINNNNNFSENKIRIFNYDKKDTDLNSQLSIDNSVLKIIKQIKEEFQNKYEENFIIESLMKLSDDVEVLRIYLSNPFLNNSKNDFKNFFNFLQFYNFTPHLDLLWTEFEDKILINSKNDSENNLLSKLIEKKGKESVIKRINFLKKYNN